MKRYAIVQGVEVPDEEICVFAVDSGKGHTPDMFLRAFEFLPLAEDARALGGVRTPVVYAVAGPPTEVSQFLESVQASIRATFNDILDKGGWLQLREEEGEPSAEVDDELMLRLIRRAVWPFPKGEVHPQTEALYPAATTLHDESGNHMVFGIWVTPVKRRDPTTATRQAERDRSMINRLIEAWWSIEVKGG